MGLSDRFRSAWIEAVEEDLECPQCASSNQSAKGMIAGEMKCDDCGYDYSYNERVSTKSRSKEWREHEEHVDELVESAMGESVTREALLEGMRFDNKDNLLVEFLDDGEQPHYILKGRTIDVEGGGDSTGYWGNDRSRKNGTEGHVHTILTDKRIVAHIPQTLGDDERNVPYDSVNGVDFDTGLIHKRLTVQTYGRTYHFSGSKSSKEECRDAAKFIRIMTE
ncbi:PH domain-containing protein [Halococcus sp. IIIV-5B]|uniref:PH domain-containing protein n=1 Tax=Halococcus sp. IIIV-5B TaxID=2321230 RepID=UPI000E717107|nr:PH domain-containing protein [Halococcus sp. IIIV-5B]RJT03895.1 hypothetical protein D3261_10685 [Halococcus sp. IIIV-5B]